MTLALSQAALEILDSMDSLLDTDNHADGNNQDELLRLESDDGEYDNGVVNINGLVGVDPDDSANSRECDSADIIPYDDAAFTPPRHRSDIDKDDIIYGYDTKITPVASPAFSNATSPTASTSTSGYASKHLTSPEQSSISSSPYKKDDPLGSRDSRVRGSERGHPRTYKSRKGGENYTGVNPSGMVIRADPSQTPPKYQYAEEAILDPTWLDSDEEEDKEESEKDVTDHEKTSGGDIVPLTCHNDRSLSDADVSISASASQPWSIGSGSSLSVGSCGYGKICFSDLSISSSNGSSIGSGSAQVNPGWRRHRGASSSRENRDNSKREIPLTEIDMIDMGVASVISGSGACSSCDDFALDYLYDLDRRDYDLSEDDEDDGGDGVDGDDTNSYIRGINVVADDQPGFMTEDERDIDDDSRNNDVDGCGQYLPVYLQTPPKPKNEEKMISMGDEGGATIDDEHIIDASKLEENGGISVDAFISKPSEEIVSMSAPCVQENGGISVDAFISKPSEEKVSMPAPFMPELKSSKSSTMKEKVEIAKLQMPAIVTTKSSVLRPEIQRKAKDEVDISAESSANNTEEFDEQSASSSDETNICSNLSPSMPTDLNSCKVGVCCGDLVLSILDCPGSKTRKKRILRRDHLADSDSFWGSHAVSQTVSRMRQLRSNAYEITPGEVYVSSLAPEKTGRVLSNAVLDDEYVGSERRKVNVVVSSCKTSELSPTNRSLISGSFKICENSGPSPHRSQRLECIALQHMKNNEFDKALPVYHQILRIYTDEVEQCKKNGETDDKFHICIGSTLFNIGLVFMCMSDYKESLRFLNDAHAKMNKYGTLVDCVNISVMRGHANYALENFDASVRQWTGAISKLKKSSIPYRELLAEIVNNIGCVYYETGSEAKALKFLNESLQLQRKVILASVFDRNEALHQHTLVKLAVTRANIGYVHLRMKHGDLAVSSFHESLLDQNICLDEHHELVSTTMDYLAIAQLRVGNKDDAIKVYSRMLTTKIQSEGPEHKECIAILTKISLLQVKGKNKGDIQSILKKIKAYVKDNGPTQKERLERLLKVSRVSGLKTVTVRGAGRE